MLKAVSFIRRITNKCFVFLLLQYMILLDFPKLVIKNEKYNTYH